MKLDDLPLGEDGFPKVELKRKARLKPLDQSVVRNIKTGCLEWQGPKDKDGYGRIGRFGTTFRAHRIFWQRENGKIPAGKILLHSCDNPSCCEVDHLTIGTQTDNHKDMVSKSRQARGERGGKAKMKDADVLEIRRLYAEGMTQTEIAKRFPVTQSSVSLIVLRKQWTHI